MSELTSRAMRRTGREQGMEKPTIGIGKGGASQGITCEIAKQLKRTK